eukprot:4112547-Pleurochrysis_carterae.AAC.1
MSTDVEESSARIASASPPSSQGTFAAQTNQFADQQRLSQTQMNHPMPLPPQEALVSGPMLLLLGAIGIIGMACAFGAICVLRQGPPLRAYGPRGIRNTKRILMCCYSFRYA